MDFGKLTSQASSFLNKSGSSDPQAVGNTAAAPNTDGTAAPAANTGAPAAGGEDYGDKGLSFIEQKTGHTLGRDTNEKITDGARGLFEKATGKKVDPKYSN